jgi:hypothetical protein
MSNPAARSGMIIGGLFALLGASMLAMFHLFPDPDAAPGWVLWAAAGVFVFAGLSVMAQAFGWALAARLLGLAVAYLLVVPGFWIMTDADASCSAAFSGGDLTARGTADPTLCRVIFGGGAVMTSPLPSR